MAVPVSLRFVSLVLGLGLGMLSTGCGVAPPERELTMAISAPPLTLDPRGAFNADTAHVQQLIFNTLVTKGANFDFAPELALSWESDPDTSEFTFTLRQDVTFHDGRPLTAADVAFTFNSMKQSDFGKSAAFHALARVEALGAHTVKFICTGPNPGLLVDLVAVGILPDGSDADAARQPVGTGPYRLATAWPGEGDLRLTAFQEYFDGRPSADSITIRVLPDGATLVAALESGEIDLAINSGLGPEALAHLTAPGASTRIAVSHGGGLQFLVLNTERPGLADAQSRRLLARALDRPAMVDALLGGRAEVNASPLPPGHWARPGQTDDAGPASFGTGSTHSAPETATRPALPPRLEILTLAPQLDRDIALVVQESWKRLGVETSIVQADPAVFFERLRFGDFDVAVHKLTGGNQFTTIFKGGFHSRSIHTKGGSTGELNYARYSDPELDRLIDEAGRAKTKLEQRFLYSKIQTRLAAAMPWIPLWTPDNVVVFGPAIADIDLNAGGDFYCLRTAPILRCDQIQAATPAR